MRFLRRRTSPEEQYLRYKTAREAVFYGALDVDDPSIQLARTEMLERMGPAYDPTVSAWARLAYADQGFVEFATRTITPDQEEPRDLDNIAEQILGIEALGIADITGQVWANAANNFTEAAAFDRKKDLLDRGFALETATDRANEDARALALRYFSNPDRPA